MEEMKYQNVKAELDELLASLEDEENGPEEALSIDEEIVKTVWFTFGGPNIFAEIVMTPNGEVIKGRYVKGWGGEKVEIPLTEEQAEEIAVAYGLTY